MGAVLLWWIALSAMGWLAWPLAASIFRHLPDRGYACSRCLGLLLYAYLYWLLGVAGLAPNTAMAAWMLAALLVLASALAWRRQRTELGAYLRREWRHILTVEILFAAALFLYAAHKAYDPAINHTEEPMDFAFLNGILRSPRLPPNDPWMAGKPISYYYFGYLTVALLTRFMALPSSVAYNLGLAHTWALAIVGWYGVLAALFQLGGVASRRTTIGLALIGTIAIGLAGNLEGALEALWARGWMSEALARWWGIPGLAETEPSGVWLPNSDWWWWRASRVIADYNFLGKTPTVITEFPSFSLILGDLHPHVMALPYGALALALAVELYHRARAGLAQYWRCGLSVWFMPWIVGALGFVNSWDLPTFGAVCVLALGLGAWQGPGRARSRWARLASWATALVVGSVAFYLPFWATLQSQAQGIGLAYFAKTSLKHYVLCLGLYLVPIAGDAVRQFAALRQTGHRMARRRVVWTIWAALVCAPWALLAILGGWGRLLFGLGVLAVNGPWLLLALSALLTLLIVNLAAQICTPNGLPCAAPILSPGLAIVGVGLTYFTEFFYLRDLFDARMNTMFKVYYQAWVLLGIAATLAVWRLWRGGKWARVVTLCSGLILILSLYYPLAAAYTKTGGYSAEPTLDGTAYLQGKSPNAYSAYRWLQDHVRPGERLVEAVGEDYRADTSRLSAWVGAPTILGWPGHEAQWRGSDEEVIKRAADVETIYTSASEQDVLTILRFYHITYLYVGQYERERYGFDNDRMDWYASFLERVYAQGEEGLYRVPD